MAVYKKINSGYKPFIQKTKVTSPFTDIQNRAKVDDSLKTSFGVERLHVNSLELKTKEQGPNGEPVYGPDSGDDRIRFVGNGWKTVFTQYGTRPNAGNVAGDYMELTFYGTGLNIMTTTYITSLDLRVSVDGGAEGANIFSGSLSDVLGGRNYNQRSISPVVSGLSLGWHTVKIEDKTANNTDIFGFEIINESADMTVKAGKAHGNGNEYIVESDLSVSYNTGFDNVDDVDVSSKGGRVITYVDPVDGQVKKRLTNVDDTLGPEIVLNGNFNADLSNWTDVSTGSSTTAWSSDNGGSLLLTNSGVGGQNAAIEQTITTVVGESYEVSISAPSGGTAVNQQIVVYFGGLSGEAFVLDANSNQTKSVVFTATSTSTVIRITTGSSLAAGTSYADVVSVKLSPTKFLALTDHSEEAIYRRINWREFGRNRGDDFSTLSTSTSDRAFTLDDGTTTLVGNDVNGTSNNNGLLIFTDNVGFLTITFVGTGLDILCDTNGIVPSQADNANANSYEVFINGTSVGNLPVNINEVDNKIIKICSGLPYGTHTVKIQRNVVSSFSIGVQNFIIYQPKKPTLPEGSVELADYNLMADFSFTDYQATNTAQQVSQGVVRKPNTREMVYIGNWNISSVDGNGFPSGFTVQGVNNGDTMEYTFFGTGFDARFVGAPSDTNTTITLNETLLTAANFPTATFTTSSALTAYDDVNAILLFARADTRRNLGFAVSGLPLGLYTVVFENTGAQPLRPESIDIITPIHSPHTTFGSLSMKDVRNFDSAKDVNGDVKDIEIFANYADSITRITSSRGVSQILNLSTGRHMLYFEEPSVSVASQKIKAASSTEILVSFINGSGSTLSHTYSGLAFDTRQDNGVLEASAGNSINIAYKAQKDEFEE